MVSPRRRKLLPSPRNPRPPRPERLPSRLQLVNSNRICPLRPRETTMTTSVRTKTMTMATTRVPRRRGRKPLLRLFRRLRAVVVRDRVNDRTRRWLQPIHPPYWILSRTYWMIVIGMIYEGFQRVSLGEKLSLPR